MNIMNRCTKLYQLTIIYMILFTSTIISAPQGPVKQGTDKVRILNATPELLVFTLIPTKLSLTNRYNERYGDVVEYFVHELLPGQYLDIRNLERSVTDYDRVLWVVTGEQKSYLESSMMSDQQRDKKYVSAVPVGSSKKIIIEKKGNVFVGAKDSVKINQQATDYLKIGNIAAKKLCGRGVPLTPQENE